MKEPAVLIHVALYQPKIPPNTGAVARQCVGMDAALHLIGPVAFDLSEHRVKRAGLDYWPHLTLHVHESPEVFLEWLGEREPWLVSKHGAMRYDGPAYVDEDVLIFGCELTGLPAAWHERWPGRVVSIPMLGKVRSYNLSNAVAVVLAQANLRAGRFDEQRLGGGG